jgi:hypothetical protein
MGRTGLRSLIMLAKLTASPGFTRRREDYLEACLDIFELSPEHREELATLLEEIRR